MQMNVQPYSHNHNLQFVSTEEVESKIVSMAVGIRGPLRQIFYLLPNLSIASIGSREIGEPGTGSPTWPSYYLCEEGSNKVRGRAFLWLSSKNSYVCR